MIISAATNDSTGVCGFAWPVKHFQKCDTNFLVYEFLVHKLIFPDQPISRNPPATFATKTPQEY